MSKPLPLHVFFSHPHSAHTYHRVAVHDGYEDFVAWLKEELRGFFSEAKVTYKGRPLLFMRRDSHEFRLTFTPRSEFSEEEHNVISAWINEKWEVEQ